MQAPVQPEPDLQALYMATLTLKRMAEGGIYDQLGGGFCRYSVDEYWMIPHFEKMLYDNGALLACTHRPRLRPATRCSRASRGETADWLLRDLRGAGGRLLSSSTPTPKATKAVSTSGSPRRCARCWPADYAVFAPRFGLDREPNFEAGRLAPACYRPLEDIAASAGMALEDATARLGRGAREAARVRRNSGSGRPATTRC